MSQVKLDFSDSYLLNVPRAMVYSRSIYARDCKNTIPKPPAKCFLLIWDIKNECLSLVHRESVDVVFVDIR